MFLCNTGARMFVRTKRSGKQNYLQIVENHREEGRVRQRVICTLGRLDVLKLTGQIDGLLSSCARFAEGVAVVEGVRAGSMAAAETIRIGPGLVFGRLWGELGLEEIVREMASSRRYGFSVERGG